MAGPSRTPPAGESAPVHAWGAPRDGLQAGIRVAPASDPGAPPGAVTVTAALRNAAPQALSVSGAAALLLHTGAETRTLAEGPRSATPLRIGAGEVLEVAAWRITPDMAATPGAGAGAAPSVTARVQVAGDLWLVSGSLGLAPGTAQPDGRT